MGNERQNEHIQRCLANPSLFRGRLPEGVDPNLFPWHTHAYQENSSQVMHVNAFGHAAEIFGENIDPLLTGFLKKGFPALTNASPKNWKVELEYEDAALLNEYGRGKTQPTSVDVLCSCSDWVIAIEAKFDSDAKSGFGKCGQVKKQKDGSIWCRGYYGTGSDEKKGTSASCRLENWEGLRSPRLYWTVGKRYFQPTVFEQQGSGAECPFAGSNYQLMRNFLLAACYAERSGKRNFAVVVVCPADREERLRDQVARFQTDILLPEFRQNIHLAHYEDLIERMAQSGNPEGEGLAGFLTERIETLIPRL